MGVTAVYLGCELYSLKLLTALILRGFSNVGVQMSAIDSQYFRMVVLISTIVGLLILSYS